jgi:hypothetical protein
MTEFRKGALLPPLLFVAAFAAVFVYVLVWNHKNGQPSGGIGESLPVAALIVIAVSLPFAAVFWWKGNRRRAYGIVTSCLGTPVLLAVLFWAWLTLFKVNLLPH